MKIGFVITGLGIGGAEKFLLNLLPNLKYKKFIVSLTNLNDFGMKLERKGIKVYYLGLNKFNFLQTVFKFKRIINYEKPDLLDTYLIHANLYGRLFGKLFGIKKVVCSIRSDYSNFKFLKFLDKITQNLVDLYILNSRALLKYFYNEISTNVKRVKILRNGIDIKEVYNEIEKNFNIRRDLGLKKSSFLVEFVGRLIPDKNLPILIKAIKLCDKKIYLLIVGDGPERRNLKKLINKLKLNNRIFLLGKRKDAINFLNDSNVFVLPSLREGMSRALLEAMALKKVCIVSNINQNKVLIKDGFNGMIFDPRNVNDLAKKIMLVYNDKIQADFGKRCYEIIKNKFNLHEIITQYENLMTLLYNES